jgi:methylated-DNA-protein-cysteine methyltransferase-like protein
MAAPSLLTTPAARERAIIQAVRAVPRGTAVSYGEIARRVGLPGRARLVGQVLRKAGDSELPWHRVTGAGGRIAFPLGSAEFKQQARRLQREGLMVQRARVVLPQMRAGDLDAALWAPPAPRKRRR